MSLVKPTEATGHTPLPWHIGMRPGPMIYGPRGEQVADMQFSLMDKIEHHENIFYIIRAANNHHALFRALSDLLEEAQHYGIGGKHGDRVMKQAQEALNNAQEL